VFARGEGDEFLGDIEFIWGGRHARNSIPDLARTFPASGLHEAGKKEGAENGALSRRRPQTL